MSSPEPPHRPPEGRLDGADFFVLKDAKVCRKWKKALLFVGNKVVLGSARFALHLDPVPDEGRL